LTNHLGKHSTGSSTLRRTLGKLLADELNLVKHPKGDRYWFGTDGEARLRDWMIVHAKITFLLDQSPRLIETAFVSNFGQNLTLNKNGKIECKSG
jgi:hypothetical protein